MSEAGDPTKQQEAETSEVSVKAQQLCAGELPSSGDSESAMEARAALSKTEQEIATVLSALKLPRLVSKLRRNCWLYPNRLQ